LIPVRVTSSLCFKLQKYIYVLNKKSALPCLQIVLGDIVFVNLMNVDYLVSFSDSQFNLINNHVPTSALCLIVSCVHSESTFSSIAQLLHKQEQLVITAKRQYGMIQSLRR
jgi:hypothetical protein